MNIDLLCTLGPSSLNEYTIKRLERLNVSLFRINLSHTDIYDLTDVIHLIREHSSVPICLDTEGAQVRTGDFRESTVELIENSFIEICRDYTIGNSLRFNFCPRNIVDKLKIGDFISIDFNDVLAYVVEKRGDGVVLRVVNGGQIGQNKAVLFKSGVSLPPLTQKDCEAITIGRDLGVRHVALSFANQVEDVDMLRELAGEDAFLISKIESRRGVANLDSIATASDALLLDRGDLSREVPIECIPAMQKHIISQANKLGVKIYVATNLLETMVKTPTPTRAELNDIYNTLADGADGLVLAAETAVGKYPVKCASIVDLVMNEFSKRHANKEELFNELPVQSLLVEPHGGELVYQDANADDRLTVEGSKAITVGADILNDCQLIATGVYSPLTGFMDRETLSSVLDNNKLPDGLVWTMPIVLPVPGEIANVVSIGECIKLVAENGKHHAIMYLKDIFPFDLDIIAQKWFGTTSLNHQGVKRLASLGDHFLSGPIKLISKVPHSFTQYELTPRQWRFVFSHKGWRHVIGFHTRNVAHRAHEYIQLEALKRTQADGLLISPVIGGKKTDDFRCGPIFKSYQFLLESDIYPNGRVMLGSFYAYSRYCGPREIVFTALCQKNMGCDYFIIGRDSTGIGDFYSLDDNRRLFEAVGDIGITPVYFDDIGFDPKSGKYRTLGSSEELEPINWTRFREAILNREKLPQWFVRRPIQEMLLSELTGGREIFHE